MSHSEYTTVLRFSGVHKRCGSVAALKGITAPGVDVSHLRRRMGMVFQGFELFPHMTMVVVAHEMSCARRVANGIIVFDNGHVVEEGSPAPIFDHPLQERTRDFPGHLGWSG
ncbi:MAG TPA: hypothetical protein DCP03_13090 [Polaromonas sp.]|uniref:hypothetical protein n=1 Tax=Polaromonas sp. UBA4122 TaxID=1947074 RepID=UPI000EC0963C|nr:hypothetical protein [Polaromonas sp. UBA4122]HAL38984.1 hypothetical protein [Polaromonas sp.]